MLLLMEAYRKFGSEVVRQKRASLRHSLIKGELLLSGTKRPHRFYPCASAISSLQSFIKLVVFL